MTVMLKDNNIIVFKAQTKLVLFLQYATIKYTIKAIHLVFKDI